MEMKYRSNAQLRLCGSSSSRRSFSCQSLSMIAIRPFNVMGTWHIFVFFACLNTAAQASVYTDGGAILKENLNSNVYGRKEEFPFDSLLESYQEPHISNYHNIFKNKIKNDVDLSGDIDDEYLRQILSELQTSNTNKFLDEIYGTDTGNSRNPKDVKQMNIAHKNTNKVSIDEKNERDEILLKLDELLNAQHELEEEITKQKLNNNIPADKEETLELPTGRENTEPMIPQKKGQNEFVSFVEPVEQSLRTQFQPVDKRRSSNSDGYLGNAPRYSSSLLLIAVGTVMSVGVVGTVASGAYYLKRRSETPDDGEYAPYAGTGPGYKTKKGNTGDETLAYKAQLHQYQQAKQKIICGEDAPGIIESDGEDGADEENNYSVYECPGLAPTVDIEVCNPNFAVQP